MRGYRHSPETIKRMSNTKLLSNPMSGKISHMRGEHFQVTITDASAVVVARRNLIKCHTWYLLVED